MGLVFGDDPYYVSRPSPAHSYRALTGLPKAKSRYSATRYARTSGSTKRSASRFSKISVSRSRVRYSSYRVGGPKYRKRVASSRLPFKTVTKSIFKTTKYSPVRASSTRRTVSTRNFSSRQTLSTTRSNTTYQRDFAPRYAQSSYSMPPVNSFPRSVYTQSPVSTAPQTPPSNAGGSYSNTGWSGRGSSASTDWPWAERRASYSPGEFGSSSRRYTRTNSADYGRAPASSGGNGSYTSTTRNPDGTYEVFTMDGDGNSTSTAFSVDGVATSSLETVRDQDGRHSIYRGSNGYESRSSHLRDGTYTSRTKSDGQIDFYKAIGNQSQLVTQRKDGTGSVMQTQTGPDGSEWRRYQAFDDSYGLYESHTRLGPDGTQFRRSMQLNTKGKVTFGQATHTVPGVGTRGMEFNQYGGTRTWESRS